MLDPLHAAVVENLDGLGILGGVFGGKWDVGEGSQVGGQPQVQLSLHPTRVALDAPEELLYVLVLKILLLAGGLGK